MKTFSSFYTSKKIDSPVLVYSIIYYDVCTLAMHVELIQPRWVRTDVCTVQESV